CIQRPPIGPGLQMHFPRSETEDFVTSVKPHLWPRPRKDPDPILSPHQLKFPRQGVFLNVPSRYDRDGPLVIDSLNFFTANTVCEQQHVFLAQENDLPINIDRPLSSHLQF